MRERTEVLLDILGFLGAERPSKTYQYYSNHGCLAADYMRHKHMQVDHDRLCLEIGTGAYDKIFRGHEGEWGWTYGKAAERAKEVLAVTPVAA